MRRAAFISLLFLLGCASTSRSQSSALEHDTVECEREAEHHALPYNSFSAHREAESYEHCMRDKGW